MVRFQGAATTTGLILYRCGWISRLLPFQYPRCWVLGPVDPARILDGVYIRQRWQMEQIEQQIVGRSLRGKPERVIRLRPGSMEVPEYRLTIAGVSSNTC